MMEKGRALFKIIAVVFTLLFAQALLLSGPSPEGSGSTSVNDGQVNGTLPLASIINGTSPFTTWNQNSRETMARYGNSLFLTFIDRNDEGKDGILLTRSVDNGSTWDDPVRLWNNVECTSIKSSIMVYGDTLYAFLNENREVDKTTRSLYCVEIPVDDHRNQSSYVMNRIDDAEQGYIMDFNSVIFNEEVYVFWARSHFINTLYRVRGENGKWGPTKTIGLNKNTSNICVRTSSITGNETIHFMYGYPHTNQVYMTTSVDGDNWSSEEVLFSLADSIDKVAFVELNGIFHMTVGERFGRDVYYSRSDDGIKWDNLTKMGEKEKSVIEGDDFQNHHVTITASEETGKIFLAHDHEDGIAIRCSSDNGTSFSKIFMMTDEGFHHPVLDSSGTYLLHTEFLETLHIRHLSMEIIEDPSENISDPDDNETDPEDPPVNSTDPDDNETEPEDPPVNSTDPDDNETGPENPPENSTDTEEPVVNSTDSEQPDGEPLDINVETEVNIENETGQILLSVIMKPVDKYQVKEFRWYLNGSELIGTGENLSFFLSPGEYDILLLVEENNGSLIKHWVSVDIPQNGENRDNGYNGLLIFILFAVSVFIAILLTALFLILKPKRKMKYTELQEVPLQSDFKEFEPDLEDGKVRGGFLHSGSINLEMSKPDVVPLPHIDRNSSVSKNFHVTNIGVIKKGVVSKEIHKDQRSRKLELTNKLKSNRSSGFLDRKTYIEIKELLDEIGR